MVSPHYALLVPLYCSKSSVTSPLESGRKPLVGTCGARSKGIGSRSHSKTSSEHFGKCAMDQDVGGGLLRQTKQGMPSLPLSNIVQADRVAKKTRGTAQSHEKIVIYATSSKLGLIYVLLILCSALSRRYTCVLCLAN